MNFILHWAEKIGFYIPSTLSRADFGPEPSREMAARFQAAAEAFEAEARDLAARTYLRFDRQAGHWREAVLAKGDKPLPSEDPQGAYQLYARNSQAKWQRAQAERVGGRVWK
jgi:hypothetical protein